MSKLTWRIDGGDDEISKRRRGEFPPQKKRPTKTKVCLDQSTISYSTCTPETGVERVQNRDSTPHLLQSRRPPVCVLDSDADSEDELRVLVAQELSRNRKIVATEDEGTLEVVGNDFVVKSNTFWGGRENGFTLQLGLKPSKNDEEYDSADTDEILTQNKKAGKSEDLSQMETGGSKSPEKSRKIGWKEAAKTHKNAQTPTESESGNDAESLSESIDSDYEAVMGNCHRLELSLADLEDLAKNLEGEESNDDAKARPNEMPELSSEHEPGPKRMQAKKKGINPEDILASLFEPDEDKEKKKKKDKKSCLPAFVGTKDLFGSTAVPTGLKRSAERVNCEFDEDPKRQRQDLKTLEDNESSSAQVPTLNKNDIMVHTDCSTDKIEMPQEPKKLISKPSSFLKINDQIYSVPKQPTSLPQTKHSPRSSSSSDEEEEEQAVVLEPKTSKVHRTSASNTTGYSEESEMSSDKEKEKSIKPEAASKPRSRQINENTGSGPKSFQQSVLDPGKQQQDNQKRLAAVEQRQKESEQQKKLIQCALAKVVSSQRTRCASFFKVDTKDSIQGSY